MRTHFKTTVFFCDYRTHATYVELGYVITPAPLHRQSLHVCLCRTEGQGTKHKGIDSLTTATRLTMVGTRSAYLQQQQQLQPAAP